MEFGRIFCIFCFGCFCSGQAPAVVQRVYQKRTCVWETFQANCGPNKVIMIEEALHGRMRNDSGCFTLAPGEQPCSADVRLFVEKQCAGRRQCSFKPTNDNLKYVAGNCTKYDEKFLDIGYRCEDAYSADSETCVANQPLVVRSSSGYLANTITEETGKGSSNCPWRFEPGTMQTVHLTLLDFGVWVDRGERERRGICHIYATVRHLGSVAHGPSETLVCAGDKREKSIMIATTNIEIIMTKQSNASGNIAYFLLKFQVYDCPEIETPPGAGVEKSESGIRVYCYEDRRSFLDVRCQAGRWMPQLSLNCSTTSDSSPPSTPAVSSSSSPCSEFIPSKDVSSVERISDLHIRVNCQTGDSFEAVCVNRGWIQPQNKVCSKSDPEQTQTGDKSFPWERYLVPGGLVLLAVVVIIIAVIMCRSRRRDKREKMNKMVPQSQSGMDSNCYFTAQPLGCGAPCRPMSDIYDQLDDGGIQEDGNIAALPGCSSSDSVCGAPRSYKTLPMNDPWAGCSLERRSDTLPLRRPLPEPHEYTTPLPRDSTYLVPKEELCDPHPYDTVQAKGKI